MKQRFIYLLLTIVLLTGCSSSSSQPITPTVFVLATETPQPLPPATNTTSPVISSTEIVPELTATSTSIPLDPAEWKSWVVIPSLSPEMLAVFARGQALGRDVHVVSVIGDCESSSDWFLKDFSKDERYYNLGPYADLQETIDFFGPSLGYRSYAAVRGATATTVLTPLWADPQACESNETPLSCEYRLHNPTFAFIALGTNDVHKPEQFEPKMREIIDYTLAQGVVPILVTKADNLEGDESINLTIAKLSVEYQLPMWNFWAAVQPLPDHGLQDDLSHLTFGSNFFDNPDNLKRAWPIRNLTALQVLDAMRLEVQEK